MPRCHPCVAASARVHPGRRAGQSLRQGWSAPRRACGVPAAGLAAGAADAPGDPGHPRIAIDAPPRAIMAPPNRSSAVTALYGARPRSRRGYGGGRAGEIHSRAVRETRRPSPSLPGAPVIERPPQQGGTRTASERRTEVAPRAAPLVRRTRGAFCSREVDMIELAYIREHPDVCGRPW